MAVWIALVTGLSSGLAGSLIGTLLTVSHERAAEFRSRMLSAADDFLRYGDVARRFARNPHGATPEERFDALEAAWDDVVTAVERIRLLFGYESKAAHWAREASNQLSDVQSTIREALETNSDSPAKIEVHMHAAGMAMEEFGKAAMLQVRKHRR